MKYAVLAVALVLSANARADGIDGWGRISIGGGFRWIPNWWFHDRARAAGTPVVGGIDGGPQVTTSFGYGVTKYFELSIELLGGQQSFSVQRGDLVDPHSAFMGAALIGARLVGSDVFFTGLMPYLSVQAGPLFSSLNSDTVSNREKLTVAYSVSGGFNVRFTRTIGAGLEVRYIQARAYVPDISGFNVGGVLVSAQFTIFFPPSLKQELDVPGF